jgi:PleD family two-component response regulator
MHVDVSGLQVDPLTGLPNRGMFDAQLELAISLARDLGRQTGGMIADMNKLELINDVHGHRIGDEALRALAAELKKMAVLIVWSRGSGATNSELSSPPITMRCPHGA